MTDGDTADSVIFLGATEEAEGIDVDDVVKLQVAHVLLFPVT